MKFTHLRLRFKLGIAFVALAVTVLAVSWISLTSLGRADKNSENFVSGITARSAPAARLRTAVDTRAIYARNPVLVTKPDDMKVELTKSHADVQEGLAKLKKLANSTGASEKALGLIGNIDRSETS